MSDKLVTVASFWNSVEAGLARCRLEDAGIRCFLADQQMVDIGWYMANAIGGVKLQVSDHDAETALDVLAQPDAGESPDADHVDADSVQPAERVPRFFDEDSDEPERALTAREEDAERAWRGARIGLVLLPLQLYVVWLLLKVFASQEELRPDKRRAALWAAAISAPILIACVASLLIR